MISLLSDNVANNVFIFEKITAKLSTINTDEKLDAQASLVCILS